jgi:hypothetical protein
MASDYVWSFDTDGNVDFIRPTVTSTNPVNGASAVPITQKVNATFSKLMNYASINTADFFLTSAGRRVTGTISYFYDATNKVTIATFAPNATSAAQYALHRHHHESGARSCWQRLGRK